MNWRRVGITSMVIFLFLSVIAIPFLWPWVAVPSAMGIGFVFYLLTGQAISLSYHRNLTHRSVKFKPITRYVEAFLAMLALQGPTKDWVANHRKHHKHTDREGDPHSPHLHGFWHGLFHAHCGWFMRGDRPDYKRYARDIMRDKGLMFLDRLFPLIAVVSFVLPGLLTLLFETSARGFLAGVFWGGFIRIFLVHHITWSVNSVGHLWGERPFETNDQSANNWFLALVSFGEGYHCNHHAIPTSARLGLRNGEIDPGWYVILFLDFIGQVESKNVPRPEVIRAKLKYA